MKNVICNRREEIEQCLIPYINKPIYIKGYCWNKPFDGWTVIYDKFLEKELLFDYRGKTYPVSGFLPSRYTMSTDSSYNNAFYDTEYYKSMLEEDDDVLKHGYITHVDVYTDNFCAKIRQFKDWSYSKREDGTYDLILHSGRLMEINE